MLKFVYFFFCSTTLPNLFITIEVSALKVTMQMSKLSFFTLAFSQKNRLSQKKYDKIDFFLNWQVKNSRKLL